MTLAARWLNPTANRLSAYGSAAIGGGLAWRVVPMRRTLIAASHGPICGHPALLGLHCPSCYAALSMAGVGLGLLAAANSAG